MKIIQLQAENIKRIKAVSIKPDGALVEITGKNGQGKSSILDAIWWALAGAKHIQDVPIREGENTARIRLDLGELVVERKFTGSGTSLTVMNGDGAKFGSPQAMLDDLIGALTFDPLALTNMKPADQFEALRQTLGIDFSEINDGIADHFAKRTEVNRRAKEARASANFEIQGPIPEAPVDAADLAKRLSAALDHNASIVERQANRRNAEEECRRKEEQARRLLDEVAETRRKIEEAGTLPDMISTDDLKAELQEAETKNRAFEQHSHKMTLVKRAEALESESAELTRGIEQLRKHKADMIAHANMPVDGLSLGDGMVTLDGVPFEQASSAQQLRASVGLAMAANPKLRVIRIEQGSFLDEDNLALIAGMAEENGYQVWIERVDGSGEVGIVIEDGEVAAVNERAA